MHEGSGETLHVGLTDLMGSGTAIEGMDMGREHIVFGMVAAVKQLDKVSSTSPTEGQVDYG